VKSGALISKRVTGLLRSRLRRLIGGKLLVIWVRALEYRSTREASASAVGAPVSHCSVGALTLSWSMALAIPGVTTAPKMAIPAADMKALRDCSGSALMTTDVFCMLATGAKAEATARVERMARTENFIMAMNSEVENEGS
jgi:hypothetical protein